MQECRRVKQQFVRLKEILIPSLPWVNFINVLRAAFTLADPKSAKKLLDLTVFFALFMSLGVKAARRMLMKLTQGLTNS